MEYLDQRVLLDFEDSRDDQDSSDQLASLATPAPKVCLVWRDGLVHQAPPAPLDHLATLSPWPRPL